MEEQLIEIKRSDTDSYFGQLVQWARKEKGWSQVQLADALKISQVSVHRIEAGEQPVTLARALEICHLLEIPLERIREVGATGRLELLVQNQSQDVQDYIKDLLHGKSGEV